MKHVIGSLVVALLSGACTNQEEMPAQEPPPAPAPVAEPPPAPKKLSAEEMLRRFDECMAAFDAKDFAKVESCYAADATAEIADSGEPPAKGPAASAAMFKVFADAFNPKHERQLTLIKDNMLATVFAIDGKHTGEFKGIAPTNKEFSINVFVLVEYDADGKWKSDFAVFDMATLMGHLGQRKMPFRKTAWRSETKPVVVASGSSMEATNLDLVKRGMDAWYKGDVEALMALTADDFEAADMTMPENVKGKKNLEKQMQEMKKAFTDCKEERQIAFFAAGDYVVDVHTSSMKNTGDIPSMKLKKTDKTIVLTGTDLFEVKDGKFQKGYFFANGMAFAMQMGLIPPPKQATP
jgi:ketosteroid isomerase-like protein